MPIFLEEEDGSLQPLQAQVKPSFFHSDYTGNGKNARGVFSNNVHPVFNTNANKSRPSLYEAIKPFTVHHTISNSNKGMNCYTLFNPISPILFPVFESLVEGASNSGKPLSIELNTNELFTYELASFNSGNGTYTGFVHLMPQAIYLRKYSSNDKNVPAYPRSLVINYRVIIGRVLTSDLQNDTVTVDLYKYAGAFNSANAGKVCAYWDENLDVRDDLFNSRINCPSDIDKTVSDFLDWISKFNTSEKVIEQAQLWSSDELADPICDLIEHTINAGVPLDAIIQYIAMQFNYMEYYEVNLDVYTRIYDLLENHFDPTVINLFSLYNINLLINHTLSNLRDAKPNLPSLAHLDPNKANLRPDLTKEQKDAVLTTEPLVMVQAGAGAGKSTVINERLGYLIDNGFDPNDITVLSFTRAARDHIIELNDQVQSLTIASMIREIFKHNFPYFQSSSMDTLINVIEIEYPDDDVAHTFIKMLKQLRNSSRGSQTQMSQFIMQNTSKVWTILNTCKRMTLELEIILAYLFIDSMVIPDHIKTKYVIIDEVQDNSLLEFIYLLQFIIHQNANFFMVGDPAQTLYEFRNANPKALNTLESSKIFQVYTLQTNYRSNQYILDFDNLVSSQIEANRFSQIKLRSGQVGLAQTSDEFKKTVRIHHVESRSQNEFKASHIDSLCMRGGLVHQYIQECFDRNENVAVLAHTRDYIETFRKCFEDKLDLNPTSLISERIYDSTFASTYINSLWDATVATPPEKILETIPELAMLNKSLFIRTPQQEFFLEKFFKEWVTKNAGFINANIANFLQGNLSSDDFYDYIKKNLLMFEDRRNGLNRLMLSQRNQNRKVLPGNTTSNLFISTIHGVKGLEFDNVILVVISDKLDEQEDMRMYHVGLTRAKNSELIISHGPNPQESTVLGIYHNLIIEKLTEEEELINSNASISSDEDSVDSVEQTATANDITDGSNDSNNTDQ